MNTYIISERATSKVVAEVHALDEAEARAQGNYSIATHKVVLATPNCLHDNDIDYGKADTSKQIMADYGSKGGRIMAKLYKVIDLQGGGFMDDTYTTPMTLSALRSRYWALDEARTTHYKYFTSDYIQATWYVEFEEVVL